MQFMIKKLSPTDHLSVATFSTTATKLFRLRKLNDKSQGEIIGCVVSNMKADQRCTNITDVLKLLDGRKIKESQSVGIMLMSNSKEINRNVEVRHAYTSDFKAMSNVLNGIAGKSDRATFSDVQKTKDLSGAFAKCLDRLQTIASQDLKLVLSPQNKTITENVFAGDYKQTTVDSAVTDNFVNLYDKVMQKFIVDLSKEVSSQVLKISYKNLTKDKIKELKSAPIFTSLKRATKSTPVERDEVTVEASRLETAQMMKDSKTLAGDKMFKDAKNKIVEALNSLEDVKIDGPNNFNQMLKAELQQFLKFMQLSEYYEKFEDAKRKIVEALNFSEGIDIDGPNNLFALLKAELQQFLKLLQLPENYKKLEDAKKSILEAQNSLEDVKIDGPNNFIKMLKAELQQNLLFLQSLESYKKLEDAKKLIVEARNFLEDIDNDGPNNFSETLKAELQQFLISLQLPESYEKLEDAKNVIVEARSSVEGIDTDGPNNFIETLKAELQKFLISLKLPESYKKLEDAKKTIEGVDIDGPNNFIELLKAELQQNLIYLQLLASYKKLEDADKSIVEVLEDVKFKGPNNFIEMLKAELLKFMIFLQLPESYKKLVDAKKLIVEARNSLKDVKIYGPNNFIEMLKLNAELQQFLIFLQLPESYKKFEDAKTKIVEALNFLEDIEIDGLNNFSETLKAELQQFLLSLQLPESYKELEDAKKSIVEAQKYVEGIEMLKAELQKQVELFEKGEQVATAEDDIKEEALADTICFQIQIKDILDSR